MFFDNNVDTKYRKMLLELAKKQRTLFLRGFNAEKREVIKDTRRVGFLKKKEVPSNESVRLIDEIDSDKTAIKEYRKVSGYGNGTFWWNLPYSEVCKELINNLILRENSGNWCYEYSWEVIDTKDDIKLLMLKEEGHYTSFNISRDVSYEEKSIYSAAERADMVRNFNKKKDEKAFWDCVFSDGSPVRSLDTGDYYASKSDYYLSDEYISSRRSESYIYEMSLYTEHETSNVTAYANSKHYVLSYLLGAFHIDESGTLDFLKVQPFRLVSVQGDIEEDMINSYSDKDALVACAFYFAGSDIVEKIPMELFDKNIEKQAKNYNDALQQSQIFTCLAEKIVI